MIDWQLLFKKNGEIINKNLVNLTDKILFYYFVNLFLLIYLFYSERSS